MAPVPDAGRPDLAKPASAIPGMRAKAQRDALEDFLRAPVGETEVGTLPADMQSSLGAETPHVHLSEQTLEKQRVHHGDLTAEDYRNLPALISNPDIVAPSRARHLLFFRKLGYLYRAIVKTTEDCAENYVVSFHRTSVKEARRALKGLTPVRGSIDDLKDDAPEGPPGNPS